MTKNDVVESVFLNYYTCPQCNHHWADVYDCTVEDDCPSCGERHIEPYKSTDIIF